MIMLVTHTHYPLTITGGSPSLYSTDVSRPGNSGPFKSKVGLLSIALKITLAIASSLDAPSISVTEKLTLRGSSDGVKELE